LLLALGAVVILGGCGGSDETAPATSGDSAGADTSQAASGVDRGHYVARAEAICRRSLRETGELGRQLSRVISSAASPQRAITNGLVRPGTEILSRQGSDLRNLGPAPDSRALEIYLGLFDPIVELARQRLQAGTADEPERAHSLELMIADLENEQSLAARRFGMRACSVPFNNALGGSG
jgi:hypothetical protein